MSMICESVTVVREKAAGDREACCLPHDFHAMQSTVFLHCTSSLSGWGLPSVNRLYEHNGFTGYWVHSGGELPPPPRPPAQARPLGGGGGGAQVQSPCRAGAVQTGPSPCACLAPLFRGPARDDPFADRSGPPFVAFHAVSAGPVPCAAGFSGSGRGRKAATAIWGREAPQGRQRWCVRGPAFGQGHR